MTERAQSRRTSASPPHEVAAATFPTGAVEPSSSDAVRGLEEVEVLLRVGDMLRRLRFGTVLLVVQDGKVVQIEMAEKIRL